MLIGATVFNIVANFSPRILLHRDKKQWNLYVAENRPSFFVKFVRDPIIHSGNASAILLIAQGRLKNNHRDLVVFMYGGMDGCIYQARMIIS